MRLLIVGILLLLACCTSGCTLDTSGQPIPQGPPPAVPGESVADYGGSAIAIAFSADDISTRSPEAKVLFYEGMKNLTQYGRYNESLHYFDEALGFDPDFSEAWVAKGVALHNMKRYDDAIACYQSALAINPRDAGAWHLEAMTFRDMGRVREAAECNRRAAGLDPRYRNG